MVATFAALLASLALVTGRYPRAATELAVATDLGKRLHLSIGSRRANGSRRYLVVGTVENPQNLLDNFARPSAREIIPELQDLHIGQWLAWVPRPSDR